MGGGGGRNELQATCCGTKATSRLIGCRCFRRLSAHAQDIGDRPKLLKMVETAATEEGAIRTTLAAARWSHPSLNDNPGYKERISQRRSVDGSVTSPEKRESVADSESSGDEFGPGKRRGANPTAQTPRESRALLGDSAIDSGSTRR